MTQGLVMRNTEPAEAAHTADRNLLGESELLLRLPVSLRSIRNWRAAGKLPYIRLGRRVLYHWPSVEAALLRHQKGGVL